MHQHDLDLIAALAEGTLGGDAASAAEAEVASCADCSVDLAAQRTALESIAEAAQPGLTMAESASLRRGVEAALGRAPTVAEESRRRPWLALVTAGAVVVVLLAVAPLVNLLSTDSGADSAATDTTVAEASQELNADAAPAATEAPATTSLAAAEAPAAALDDGATTAGGEGEDRAAAWELLAPALRFQAPADLDQLLRDVALGVAELDQVRALTPDEVTYYSETLDAAPAEGVSECSTEALLGEVDGGVGLVAVGTTDFDGVELLIVVVADEAERLRALAVDAASCEVVGVLGGG